VIFLGSYPRADKLQISVTPRYDNQAFQDARAWLESLDR
jgi:prephenate dehydratase